ncbi:MAG: FkbM family methyltransferase [Burkholderiales bacterium]|nr:FkbM family methyltransferase [Burkholderiales bacterium]
MVSAVSKLTAILTHTRNPIPLLLDYAGVQRSPYRVSSRSVVLELRPGMGDRYGFYEVAIRDDYFSAGQTISPGDTVIDIGANVGCFALIAARRVGPTGRVIAVEPDERTFRQLERNIELNDATNVTARCVAIGGYRGSIPFFIRSDSALFNSIYSHPQHVAASRTVPMITLADLMSEEAIDACRYLKLDCEGAEYDIVESLTSEVSGRIAQITLELHRIQGKDPGVLRKKLQDLGFARASESGLLYYRRDPQGAAA